MTQISPLCTSKPETTSGVVVKRLQILEWGRGSKIKLDVLYQLTPTQPRVASAWIVEVPGSTRIDIAPLSGLVACGLLFDSPENCRRVPAGEVVVSIGNNSDDESGRDDFENDEAQSSYKGPLDMMNALEEVLPMRLAAVQLDSFNFLSAILF
ncbi:hypothetical protein ACE6H2_023196 [Prunus campanulata]